MKKRKVEFIFDDRSLAPLPDIYPPGTLFDVVTVRNPQTGEEREFLIPKREKNKCPTCGQYL